MICAAYESKVVRRVRLFAIVSPTRYWSSGNGHPVCVWWNRRCATARYCDFITYVKCSEFNSFAGGSDNTSCILSLCCCFWRVKLNLRAHGVPGVGNRPNPRQTVFVVVWLLASRDSTSGLFDALCCRLGDKEAFQNPDLTCPTPLPPAFALP